MRSTALSLALATAIGAVAPAVYAGDEFTAADVLAWDRDNQTGYIETSVAMAGVMASKSRSPTLKCINAWYFEDSSKRDERNDAFLSAFEEYGSYHPGIVIAAVIESECGSLNFSE